VNQLLQPRRLWVVRDALTTVGIVAAVLVWLEFTRSGGLPVDVRYYWEADPGNLYPHPELGERNGYNYSPAFEIIVAWGRLLPFELFVALWRAILLMALVYLAGPFTIIALFTVPVASEINAGNVQILLALAVASSFRWPAAWAFVLLTKLTPGVGLVWFALRREWRALMFAVGATIAIAAVSFAPNPDAWFGYVRLLTGEPAPAVSPYYLSFWVRLPFALAFIIFGAWRGFRWPVVVGATLALPVYYIISTSMLVGTLPFLRGEISRRVEARWPGALGRKRTG
jgi:glycosyl transferase family 87